MDLSRLLRVCGVFVVALPLCVAVTAEDILARMDAASAKFLQVSADVQRTTHTKILDEDSVESGSLRMRRLPTGEIQGLVILTKPDQKYYAFAKRTLRIYQPKINTVQEFDLGRHGEQLDQFLSIGFGTSGKELAKSYEVQVIADNKIANTTRVRLVPRDAEVKKYLTRIDLWITDGNYPIQEKLLEPSGDTILVNYSSVRINPNITAAAFELHTAPNPKVEYPQR
ncbi:MAG TPA: outer membrane lipoprotein carrier protein LolA [Bryobacteraceae bacterium]|nr:outer membrane lipoprotein carrier protein LolA [Bryobacteraceae bacterium]